MAPQRLLVERARWLSKGVMLMTNVLGVRVLG